MALSSAQLKDIISNVRQGARLESADIVQLLSLEQADALETLFKAARSIRDAHTGKVVFTYGFAYMSTFCRNDCHYCYFRSANKLPQRYRKKATDILEVARCLSKEGVNLIDLTMGEDPLYHTAQDRGVDELVQLVKAIKMETDLSVMVSPGVVPDRILERLAAAGATWYALYQETHNPKLFTELRAGQSFDERLEKKRAARGLNMLIEEGIMSGVGESHDDIAHSLDVMRQLDADQVRVMKFVPQPGTPMSNVREQTSLRECLIIALLRMAFPDRLIPASLDVDGLAGLKMRLDAGANVVTSLVPPTFGLSGVAHSDLDIENSKRTMAGIRPILSECGLTSASRTDYLHWIRNRQEQLLPCN